MEQYFGRDKHNFIADACDHNQTMWGRPGVSGPPYPRGSTPYPRPFFFFFFFFLNYYSGTPAQNSGTLLRVCRPQGSLFETNFRRLRLGSHVYIFSKFWPFLLLSTCRVLSRIVANISETSLLFSK